MTGLYIHIPFCQSRCIYCDFVSSTLGEEWQMRYLQSLGREAAERRNENGVARARTIYIGGGTPSQLSPNALDLLFELIARNFEFDSHAEFTFEANPDDITPELLARLRQSPVNRVSMGIQSTNDHVLRFLHRRHTAQQALRAIELLRQAGIYNISCDLIYGLPGQNLQQFRLDLDTLLATDIPHLSAYALQYEPGTALHTMLHEGKIPPEDEELSLACYQWLMERTAQAGMEHYEISNFALPGMHSKHNSSYWQGLPYLGLGAGAHSYDGKRTRRANTANIKSYISGDYETETELLSDDELYDERVMLGLRTSQGVSLARLEQDFGPQRRHYLERMALPHLRAGRLQKKGEQLVLTRESLFICDDVISDLLAP